MNIIELHDSVWRQLGMRRAQLPHALLLAGQRGIGKFELARAFAESLLCENATAAGSACGKCLACRWLAQGNHPDLRVLQPSGLGESENLAAIEGEEGARKKASQQITIDQVRALDDFLHVGTHRHGARVVLINPAEAMNRATANALLKSLEEPVAGTVFILVASEAQRLLPTIRSRCQSLQVRQPAPELAVAWLKQAGIGKGDDGAQWLALAGGAPLLALELAGSGERTLFEAVLAQVARGEGIDPLAAAAGIDKMVKADKRPAPLKRTLEWAQKWLFDLTLASAGQPPRYFLAQAAVLQRLARATDMRQLLVFNRKTIQCRRQCEQPLNSRLFLEDFFLGYAGLFVSSREPVQDS